MELHTHLHSENGPLLSQTGNFFSFKSSFRQVISFKYSPNADYSSIMCLSSGLVIHACHFYLEVDIIWFFWTKPACLSYVFNTDLCRGTMEEEGGITFADGSTDCPLLQHCLILNILQTSANFMRTICRCWSS